MIDTQTVKMLAQYKAWADKVMFDGVAALPPGEAEKERKTLFKSIIGTLNHMYVVDLICRRISNAASTASARATSCCIQNCRRSGLHSKR